MNAKIYVRNVKHTMKGLLTWSLKRAIGPYRKQSRWLRQVQWYSAQELQQLQLKYLKDLVKHVYETVPYYRQLMTREGFTPADIHALEDIQRFPILTKQDILSAGASLHSRKYPKLLTKTGYSGGTTGVRVALLRDLWSIGNEHAFVRRQFDWAGLTTQDVCAYLSWRIVCPPGQQQDYPYWYDAAMKELVLSTFHLSNSTIPTYLELLVKYKVMAMVGYPSAIASIARYCLRDSIKIPMKAVLTTSENLDAFQRKQISEAFECPVYDFYGGSERVCYIHTCSEGSYHILSEYGITELIEIPEQPGIRKIVATGFWNRAMPLIRYDTGDLVIPGTGMCSCGRAYPCVGKIIGRQSQIIKTPSGREFGATAVECIMEFILHDLASFPIFEAQMILYEGFHLVLEYVSERSLYAGEEEKINSLVKFHIPEDFSIELRRVSSIQKTASGKALSLVFNPSTQKTTI